MSSSINFRPRIVTLCIALALLGFSAAHAACVPSGTAGDDTIVCTGTDTSGVDSIGGNDTVSIEPGAILKRDDTILGIFFDTKVTAIDAGSGNDTVTNHGTVEINADALAIGPMVAPGKAELTSLGIGTGIGTNSVENHSVLNIDGTATAVAGGAMFGTGVVPLLASSTAATDSTGMKGDVGTDTLSNLLGGNMTVKSVSDATMADLSLTSTGLSLTMDVVWDGGTSATATAVGMKGQAGDDHLVNTGTQDVTADSTARSLTVTGTHQGLAVSVNSTKSSATATGLSGGDGIDTIDSLGALTVTSKSWTGALDLSGLTAKKDTKGVVKSFMGTRADAIATGIDSGAGGGMITGTGSLVVKAISDAYGISASWTPETDNPGWVGWVNTLASPWLEAGLDFVFDFESGTTATATAIGIAGGDGTDWIHNSAAMEIDASSSSYQLDISVDAGKLDEKVWKDVGQSLVGVLSKGAKLLLMTEGGSQPATKATAIKGGAGTDTIVNQGNIRLDSDATARSLTVTLANEALDLDFITALFEGGTSSASEAYGITGDAGTDSIINLAGGKIDVGAYSLANANGVSGAFKGLTQTTVTSDATANAKGVDGGTEDDILENHGEILVEAESNAVSVGLSVNLEGGALALDAIFDGGTKATSTATGMSGDDGIDTLRNFGKIAVGKEVDSDSMARSIGVAGALGIKTLNVAVAAVTSTATTTFAGIDGGTGDDTIENGTAGEIIVDAKADAASASVALSGTGVALALDAVWDGGTKAIASAKGIAGGDGSDGITSKGRVDVKSTADVNSNGIALTGAGVAGAVVTSSANATSIGLEGGEGDDNVDNYGEIIANAQSDALSVSVALAGSGVALAMDAVWDGGTKATSTATGISGDSGTDTLRNFGKIEVGKGVGTDATARSVGVAGVFNISSLNVAAAVVTSTASSTFSGMTGGDGNDLLRNEVGTELLVDAKADAASTSVAFTGTGVALALDAVWDGGTRAFATGYGLSGGTGSDFLSNLGMVDITSTAVTRSTGVSASGIGVAGAVVASTGTAAATGMDGGDGADTLFNMLVGEIVAKADASAASTSVALTFNGASAAYAGTEAIADAWGMAGGTGQDSLINNGNITAIGLADAKSTGVSGNIFGAAAAFAGAVADARPTGMAGGDDADTLTNTGSIDVKAKSKVDASSLSFNLAGVAYSKVAESTAEVLAMGIDGGTGDDTLTNTGSIMIGLADGAEPMAKAYARSASWNLVGAALSDAVLSATARATGIEGGDGNDWILNTGTITVGPGLGGPAMVYGDVSGSSWTFAGGAATDATATVTSESTGLAGGDGNDVIRNEGMVTVYAYSDLLAENGANATFGGSSSSATTTANATAKGMDGGSGNSVLANSGVLAIYAHAKNKASNRSDTGWLFGDGDATSNADTTVAGYGMAATDGINDISNDHGRTIDVTVTSFADAYSYSDGGDIWNGDARATTTATVTSDSAGMLAGDGTNTIANDGAITVITSKAVADTAMAYAYSDADGDGIDGDGWGKATAKAEATVAGIRAGNGTNIINNTGSVNVTAEPTSYAKVKIDGDNTGNATGNTYSTATALAVGIDIGDGASEIFNSGVLSVVARPVADVSRSVDEGWAGDARGGNTATASATSLGIQTGNGNHLISNTGTITVSAKATSNYSSASLSSNAIGIQTGSGDDWIFNLGSISTTINDVLGAGVAVTSGDGNDQLTLGAGSTTVGNIDLGSGDDTLTLVNNPSVTAANVNGGSGFNTLIMDGVGLVAFNPVGFQTMIKQSPGTYELANPMTGLSQIKITDGTLLSNHAFSFAPVGQDSVDFETWLYGNDSYGKLMLASAELGGSLTVVKGTGLYSNGMTYDIIQTTAGLSGTFATTVLPEATPLLSFSLNIIPDTVQVQTHTASYTSVARNRVAMTVARHLDAIAPLATGDLADVMGEVQGLTDLGEFNTALTSLSPESYDGLTRAAFASQQAQTTQLFNRLGALHASEQLAGRSASSFAPVHLAYGGNSLSLASLFDGEKRQPGKHGMWLEAFGQWGDQDNDAAGYTGFDSHTAGLTLGYDRKWGANGIAGAALGYSRTDLDFSASRANGDIRARSLSLYGSWNKDGAYAQGVLSYGRNNYDQARWVNVGGIDRRAVSDHDGNVLAASLVGGFMSGSGAWSRGPYAALHYARIGEDSFRETGAGGVDLLVGSRSTGALNAELGARALHSVKWRNGDLVTDLSAAWAHDFGIDDRVITAGFAGAPNTSFALQGQDAQRNGLNLGAGLSYVNKKGLTATLRYQGDVRESFRSHAVFGELRINF